MKPSVTAGLRRLLPALPLIGLLAGCAPRAAPPPSGGKEIAMSLPVTSSAFAAGAPIPAKYTCDGADVSPPLAWSSVPAAAKSLVLICDDPDAPSGTWTHWILYNLPATTTTLPEGAPQTGTRADGEQQGINDFQRSGYGGPCPPPGKPHRYFFRLYVLDTPLKLTANARRADVEAAMQGHLLAGGSLMGTYQRR